MSLKRHTQKCNTVKSGRRWRRRPWKLMGFRESYKGARKEARDV